MDLATGNVVTGRKAAHRRQMVHTGFLVALDSAAMMIAFGLGRLVRGSSGRPFANAMGGLRFAELMLFTIPLWVIIFGICGLYRVTVHGGRVSEVGRILAAVTGGVMLLTSAAYLSYAAPIFPSRSVPLFAVVFGVILVTAERQAVRGVMRSLFARGRGLHNVILIGTSELAERIGVSLTQRDSGYRLLAAVGRESDGAGILGTGVVPVYPTLAHALDAFPDQRIDEIVQADPDVDNEEAAELMAYTNAKGINYRFVPDKYGVFASASTLATIDGVPIMSVRLTSLDGWGAVGKRIFDVVGALLLLLVFSPLLVATAIIVKLVEPSAPVLYRQNRIGLGGRAITVLKFRSMLWRYSTGPDREFKTAEQALIAIGREELIAEFQENQKLVYDPRVSSLGRFLRSTSIDELPQLLNALQGKLSLVGPRPITPAELDRYGTQATSFLALKPGLTGLWQVYGRSSTTYQERIKLDIYYVENWSIGLDVSILARTLVSVAGRKGAI